VWFGLIPSSGGSPTPPQTVYYMMRMNEKKIRMKIEER